MGRTLIKNLNIYKEWVLELTTNINNQNDNK